MKVPALIPAAIRITIIVMGAEILIMLFLSAFPHNLNTYEAAVIDAIVLVLLSIPPICIYVIRPFLDARVKAMLELDKMALNDPLTHLANRHLIVEHLDRVVAGCTRHNEYCAVMSINLDNFKAINGQYGYEAGDTVIVEVARRIHAAVRANDIVGRLQGDEFIVLLERLESDAGTTGDRIRHIAEKLIGMISMPIAVDANAVHISASIGIRLLGVDIVNSNMAIKQAEGATLRAKAAGGGRAEIH